MKNNEVIALEAVKKDATVIQFLSDNLKNNQSIAKEAISQDPNTLQ
jgi:hypothetical protein